MNQPFIARQWTVLCESAQASAQKLSSNAGATAVEMLQAETRRFCEQSVPHSKEELESLYVQRMALSARLTAINRADAMATAFPLASIKIFETMQTFCDGDLPSTSDDFLVMSLQNVELTRALAALCEACPNA